MSAPYPGPPSDPGPSWSGAGGPPPHPSGLSSDDRGWGVAAHLSAFVGAWVFLAFLGPLVVHLVGRERGPFVAHHAKEALNFNLTVLLVTVVGGILGFLFSVVTFGIGIIPVVLVGGLLAVGWVVLTVVAAVKAWEGQGYRYPLTIRFVS